MFCVIQEIQLKKPNSYGAYQKLEADFFSLKINGVQNPPKWYYKYTGERFPRPHKEAYKISIHQSYRENGRVKKRQYNIATMSYYDLAEYGFYECSSEERIQIVADQLGCSMDSLYEIISAKLDPLQERIQKEFQKSEEYKTHKKHEKILEKYRKEKARFGKKYSIDADEYDYCYNVFGEVVNQEYLERIIQSANTSRSYRTYDYSTYTNDYFSGDSSSYFVSKDSTYTEDEKQILKKFYKALSLKFHPDVNPDTDTTKEMQLLNRLKESWKL